MRNILKKSNKNCSCNKAIFIFIRNGDCDVINYVNQPKHNNAHLDLLDIMFKKFYGNRPENLQERHSKDKHTETDTQKRTYRHTYSPVLFQT